MGQDGFIYTRRKPPVNLASESGSSAAGSCGPLRDSPAPVTGRRLVGARTNTGVSQLPRLLSLEFNPFQPSNVNTGEARGDTTAAKIFIKSQVLSEKKVTDTFSGDPTRFYAFVYKFVSTIRNLDFDEYEHLQVLLNYTSGEPKRIVASHEMGSYRNGAAALDAVWRELFITYGKSTHLRWEIKRNLADLGQISSREDVGKLRELLRICNTIDVSLRDEEGYVGLYSDMSGQKDIYDTFPSDMYSQWRKVVRRLGGNPSFDHLYEFIQDTISEVTTLETRGRRHTDRTLLSKMELVERYGLQGGGPSHGQHAEDPLSPPIEKPETSALGPSSASSTSNRCMICSSVVSLPALTPPLPTVKNI